MSRDTGVQEVFLALVVHEKSRGYVEVCVCLLNRKFAGSLTLIFGFGKFDCDSYDIANERKFKIFIFDQERLYFSYQLILFKFIELL